MSSHYSAAKTIQSESTRASYHTALEPTQNLPVCIPLIDSRDDSHDETSEPPTLDDNQSSISQSIKSVERLRSEGNFDPRFTDARHPLSLPPKLQNAVAAIVSSEPFLAAETSNSGNAIVPEPRLHVLEREIVDLSQLLEYRHQEGYLGTPSQLPNGEEEGEPHGLAGQKKPARTKQDVKLVKFEGNSETRSQSEPVSAGEVGKLVARRQKQGPVPVSERLGDVAFSCSKTEHEYAPEKGTLIGDPSREISVEDFQDGEGRSKVAAFGTLEISPDAPRSTELAMRVKSQSPAPPFFAVRRSWGVTREWYRGGNTQMTGNARELSVDWRPCTYEELTWIEMIDGMRNIDGKLDDALVENMFKLKFGWNLPMDWVSLAWEVYKDAGFKKRYLGWEPVVLGWKGRKLDES